MEKIDKSVIIKEINERLKIVNDPANHNVHTDRLRDVYAGLIDFIENLPHAK